MTIDMCPVLLPVPTLAARPMNRRAEPNRP